MSVQKDSNKPARLYTEAEYKERTTGGAFQPVPAYTEASYGELFRCYADEIRLLKRLRAARRNGCVFALVNIDAMTLYIAGDPEQYGRLVDKMAKFE